MERTNSEVRQELKNEMQVIDEVRKAIKHIEKKILFIADRQQKRIEAHEKKMYVLQTCSYSGISVKLKGPGLEPDEGIIDHFDLVDTGPYNAESCAAILQQAISPGGDYHQVRWFLSEQVKQDNVIYHFLVDKSTSGHSTSFGPDEFESKLFADCVRRIFE